MRARHSCRPSSAAPERRSDRRHRQDDGGSRSAPRTLAAPSSLAGLGGLAIGRGQSIMSKTPLSEHGAAAYAALRIQRRRRRYLEGRRHHRGGERRAASALGLRRGPTQGSVIFESLAPNARVRGGLLASFEVWRHEVEKQNEEALLMPKARPGRARRTRKCLVCILCLNHRRPTRLVLPLAEGEGKRLGSVPLGLETQWRSRSSLHRSQRMRRS